MDVFLCGFWDPNSGPWAFKVVLYWLSYLPAPLLNRWRDQYLSQLLPMDSHGTEVIFFYYPSIHKSIAHFMGSRTCENNVSVSHPFWASRKDHLNMVQVRSAQHSSTQQLLSCVVITSLFLMTKYLTHTTLRRKGLFWLAVWGCGSSWIQKLGGRSMRQLGRLYP